MIDVTNTVLSIGELSRLSGVSVHTLRFYESAGVLQPAVRAANGHRRYRRSDVLWLEFVLRLKVTEMPLAEIKKYADLRAQGEMTLDPRLAMLKLHRERLVAKIEELSNCASVLDEKISVYQEMIVKARTRTTKDTK